MTSLTKEAARAARGEAPRRRALEELLRPRPHLVDVHAPGRAHVRVDRGQRFAKDELVRSANLAAFQAGYNFGETAELFDHPYEVQAGARCRPASTRTSPATPRWPGVWSRPGTWPSCRCSSAATRSRPPPTSSTSCRSTRTSASARCRPRTRSPPSAWRSAPPSPGTSASRRRAGPGMALKSETHGPGRQPRAAAPRRSTSSAAARRPGYPPRPKRPTSSWPLYGRHAEAPLPVIAAYRPSHCFEAAIEAARIALEVPHAGHPLVRRVHRQRRRAVAAARRSTTSRTSRCPSPPSRTTQRRRRAGVLAVPPRPRDPRPAVGHPGNARADAPHRWHREGGRDRQHLLRPARTTSAWSGCGRPASPASPTTSPRPRYGARLMPTCSWWAGAPRGRRSTPPSNGSVGAARRWRGSTSCT